MKNTIKKELYKQKPIAEFNYEKDGFKNYSTVVIIDGTEEIVNFNIPIQECSFEDTISAQLLIRWISY